MTILVNRSAGAITLLVFFCGGGLFSCHQNLASADSSVLPVPLSSANVQSKASGVSSLQILLTDASDRPLVGRRVRWRPAFEPESAQTPSAATNAEGQVVLSDLLPGVRYLFSAASDNGLLIYQAYQVPLSPQDARWQWVLAPESALSLVTAKNPPTVKPARLHYLVGVKDDFKVAIATASEHLETLPLQLTDLRPQSDVVWWVNGDFAVDSILLSPPAVVGALITFVSEGGMLVINGEWAGLQSPLAEITQTLGLRLGFRVSRDTLAQPSGALIIENIHDHWLTEGVHTLAMSRAGSVSVYSPKSAQELAFAGAEHYQMVSLQAQQTVLACLRYGKGHVIVLGDSSLWSDPWFQTRDNGKLWRNLLSLPSEASVKLQ